LHSEFPVVPGLLAEDKLKNRALLATHDYLVQNIIFGKVA
jgi:hypothetical protein